MNRVLVAALCAWVGLVSFQSLASAQQPGPQFAPDPLQGPPPAYAAALTQNRAAARDGWRP